MNLQYVTISSTKSAVFVDYSAALTMGAPLCFLSDRAASQVNVEA